MESVAILWDVENVTPSTDNLFVNGLLDYANKLGRVSIATVYADWTRPHLKKLGEVLADNSFELTHVPHSRKNSADMTLITQALEMVHQYTHIGKIILVTGDADFRPLLHALRRHNIEIHVICDAKSASEDLLILADEYRDYRELITDLEDDDDKDDERDGRDRADNVLSFDDSLKLLAEAVSILIRQKRDTSLGSVKIRMKLLNDTFDESNYECRSWKQYVMKAAGRKAIIFEIKDNEMYLGLPEKQRNQQSRPDIPQIFVSLISALREAIAKGAGDGFASYSAVNNILQKRGVDFRETEYKQFKKLVNAAEKRGLVESRSDGQHWLMKLGEESVGI